MSNRVVIVGGGYAGLACLRRLARSPGRGRLAVTLLDATPYHTIKTRFHERAVLLDRERGLRFPLPTLAAASGARFLRDEVVGVDYRGGRVVGRDAEYPYDALVFSPGGRTAYFGVPGAEEHSVSLQTYEAADRASRRVDTLGVGRPGGPRRQVVVCGAGIEGLEVAAMLRQLAPPPACAITVVERSERLMARSQCGDLQRRHLRRYCERRRIELRLGQTVTRVEKDCVHLSPGGVVPADLVYWCSGVRGEELGAGEPDTPFSVNLCLQHPQHPQVFGVGDFALVDSDEPNANLGSAQRAVYQGTLAGDNVARLLAGKPLRPARYRPVGEVVGLGDYDGVGVLYGIPLTGLRAAAAKKLIEARYLGEVFGDLPASLSRSLRRSRRGGTPR